MKYLFILSILFLVACEPPKTDPTTTDLIAGKWKISSVIIDGSTVTVDASKFSFEIDKAGTYKYTEDNSDITIGNWVLENNNLLLVLDKGSSKEKQIEIIELKSNSLKLNFKVAKTYKTPEKSVSQSWSK